MRSFSKQSDHSKAVSLAQGKIEDIDRHRCHYTIHGMRCTAMGVVCDTAQWDQNVKDPFRRWLCLSHYKLRGDPLGSREVISDLVNSAQPPAKDWREDMLEQNGIGELQSAWRDMGHDEKRALVAETIHNAKRFVRNTVVARHENLSVGTIDISHDERSRQLEALYRAMTPAERSDYDGKAA